MADVSMPIPGTPDGCEVVVYDVPDGSTVLVGIEPYEISFTAECPIPAQEVRGRDVPEAPADLSMIAAIVVLAMLARTKTGR